MALCSLHLLPRSQSYLSVLYVFLHIRNLPILTTDIMYITKEDDTVVNLLLLDQGLAFSFGFRCSNLCLCLFFWFLFGSNT